MITGVNKIFTFVDDQELAKEFWTRTVGLPLVRDTVSGGPAAHRWLEVATPDRRTVLVLARRPARAPSTAGQVAAAFYATDLAATMDELRRRGVRFTKGIHHEHWGPSTTFSDPFGNLFVISQRDELVTAGQGGGDPWISPK